MQRNRSTSFRLFLTSITVIFALALRSEYVEAMGRAGAASPSTLEEKYEITQRIKAQVASIEEFLRSRRSAEGVSPDIRDTPFQTEVMRLNIAPQALGYLEYYRSSKNPAHLAEAVSRGNYLIAHMDDVLRGKVYDGMIAYTLFALYEATHQENFRIYADHIVSAMMHYNESKLVLNTGLMALMGFAASYRLDKKPEVLNKIRRALVQLKLDQNADGSFRHAFETGVDTHYSTWMAMELVLIRRVLGPNVLKYEIEASLKPLVSFISTRTRLTSADGFAAGEPRYQEVICQKENSGSCRTVYYYAAKTANEPEYDTRGWTNELGYHIFVHTSPLLAGQIDQAGSVLDFLKSIEVQGSYPDKWRYPVDAADSPAQVPFGNQARSVLRTSMVFWCLAASLNELQSPASVNAAF